MTCFRFVWSWEMAGDGSAVGSGVWMGVVASKKSGCGSNGVWMMGRWVGLRWLMVVGKEGALGYIGEGGLAICRGNAWHSCASGSWRASCVGEK